MNKEQRRKYRKARQEGLLYQTIAQDIADGHVTMLEAAEYLAKLSKARKCWMEDGHLVLWIPPDAKLLPEIEVHREVKELHVGRY